MHSKKNIFAFNFRNSLVGTQDLNSSQRTTICYGGFAEDIPAHVTGEFNL